MTQQNHGTFAGHDPHALYFQSVHHASPSPAQAGGQHYHGLAPLPHGHGHPSPDGFETLVASNSSSSRSSADLSQLKGEGGNMPPHSLSDVDLENRKAEKKHVDVNDPNRPKLPLKQRMHHFTWAWFTVVMSTGGLSLLCYAQPHQFPGLRSIGLAIYIINICLFVMVCTGMLARFFLNSGDFKASLTHPREGFFLPTFFLSVATVITSSQRYAVDEGSASHLWIIQLAFWSYVIITLIVAVGQYSFVFAAHSHGLQTMMPTWILPIFPIMLSGTIASVIAASQPSQFGLPIIVGGLSCQGLGISVSFLMYAHMVGRLMQSGLPNREHRPGLFMNVGPPSFTALALIGMSQGLPANFDHDMDGVIDANIIRTIAIVAAGFLWSLALWWWGIAALAVIQSPPVYFHLGWWAMVFPNTGFTLATISLGKVLHHSGVQWFATAMSISVVLTYFFVLYHHIRAVVIQDIMYPGRDEDVEDH